MKHTRVMVQHTLVFSSCNSCDFCCKPRCISAYCCCVCVYCCRWCSWNFRDSSSCASVTAFAVRNSSTAFTRTRFSALNRSTLPCTRYLGFSISSAACLRIIWRSHEFCLRLLLQLLRPAVSSRGAIVSVSLFSRSRFRADMSTPAEADWDEDSGWLRDTATTGGRACLGGLQSYLQATFFPAPIQHV